MHRRLAPDVAQLRAKPGAIWRLDRDMAMSARRRPYGLVYVVFNTSSCC